VYILQEKGISEKIFKSFGHANQESNLSVSQNYKTDTKKLRELREKYDKLPSDDPRGRKILDECWEIIGFKHFL
jgi:hypothetical protein